MLFKVTTYNPQMLCYVRGDQFYSFTLLPGTYTFRRIPRPYKAEGNDWVVLDQPQLVSPELKPEDIVGMDYAPFMFFSVRTLGGFHDLFIDVEEITPVMTTEEQLPEAVEAKPAKINRRIIHLPPRSYPTFVRHDPPRGSNNLYYLGLHRVKRCHPASRRVCA